jgi:polysaccharide pyruvyl transferase WcaK-like protein
LRKILLCGATHGSNFGDSLFAYIFKKHIESRYNDFEVLFTKASEYSKREIGIRSATIKDLFSSEALIYIPGGYFGQSHNENLKGSIQRFLIYYIYGLFMIIRKKPLAIIGVGAGPLERGFLKRTAVFIFNKTKIISVRDEKSQVYMEDYGVKTAINVTSDSAQIIKNEINAENNLVSKILNNIAIKNRKKILIHFTEAIGEDLYYEKVIKAIQETLCLDNNCGYIIASDCIMKSCYLNKIYNALPKDRSVIFDYKNPMDFLGIIAGADAIITPKLHVGILGCTYGKPVLSFPKHPEKTERYYQQIGYPKHCKSLYNLSKEDVKDMIEKLIWEKINLPDSIKYNAQRNFDLLDEFFSEYLLQIEKA